MSLHLSSAKERSGMGLGWAGGRNKAPGVSGTSWQGSGDTPSPAGNQRGHPGKSSSQQARSSWFTCEGIWLNKVTHHQTPSQEGLWSWMTWDSIPASLLFSYTSLSQQATLTCLSFLIYKMGIIRVDFSLDCRGDESVDGRTMLSTGCAGNA